MRIRTFLLILAVSLPGSVALAQVKPKILIIFDTSGSMLGDDGTDGSALCSATTDGKASTLYQLKAAFIDVLQGIGANEIDFALQTFPMLLNPSHTPTCATASGSYSGHYYQDSTTVDGGYYGCKVSGHTPSTQYTASCGTTTCAWYSSYLTDALKVPFSSSTPEKMMLYFNETEDAGSVTTLSDPEVRTRSTWFTPLGKSLFYAYGYFDKDVIPSITSTEKPCENLIVALFTDGAETCDSSTGHFHAPNWAASLYSSLGVKTYVVEMGLSSSCSSAGQSIASNGHGTCYPVTATTTTALKTAFQNIIAAAQPPTELCNGKDDNCDGNIDETFTTLGTTCDNGLLGACYATGTYQCTTDGTDVECNAPTKTGTAETCNGIDDDCNGQVDDGITCSCKPELCNGVDDDCDGTADNGLSGSTCGSSVGICKPGTTYCDVSQKKVICKGGTSGTTESCNGLDDDCDGQVDGMYEDCYEDAKGNAYSAGCTYRKGVWDCLGVCTTGSRLCTVGAWGTCYGAKGPATKDICNGIDDDCDGTVDEDSDCPGDSQCINGSCTLSCKAGEFVCPSGQICKNGWCIKDTCDKTACSAKGWICKAGGCVDPCEYVTCTGKYETCVKGACVDSSCYTKGCPSGQKCIDAKCQSNPCADVACQPEEFCHNGKCIALCDGIQCNAGETCQLVSDGSSRTTKCVEDDCADQRCGAGYTCINGACTADPCYAKSCDVGYVCYQGNCIVDLCEVTKCDAPYTCSYGNCVLGDAGTITDMIAAGAGGVACAAGQGGDLSSLGGPVLVVGIGLGLLLISRTRTGRGRRRG
jgi:hypothetical protein